MAKSYNAITANIAKRTGEETALIKMFEDMNKSMNAISDNKGGEEDVALINKVLGHKYLCLEYPAIASCHG